MYVRNFMEFRALMDQSTLYVLIKHDLTCLMRRLHFLLYDFPKRHGGLFGIIMT